MFIKIQDGGCRHLEFRKTVAISLLLDRFAQNWVGMLKISHKTHRFVEICTLYKIQDGGCRHREFRKNIAISWFLHQSAPNLVGML